MLEWLYRKVMFSPALQCFRAGVGAQLINWGTCNDKSIWRAKHLGEGQLLLICIKILVQEPVEPCWVSSFSINVA